MADDFSDYANHAARTHPKHAKDDTTMIGETMQQMGQQHADKLTAAKRKKMPQKDFAGPNKSFPDSDPTHARLAIGGATRSYNAGNISASQENSIKAQARAKLAC